MFDHVYDQLKVTGAIGIIPTDTVYGVVARAQDVDAVARLYKLKHRQNKPGTLIAATRQQLEELGLKHRYLVAVEQFWPGPVSVVIPAVNTELAYLHQGKMTLAVRIPNHPELLQLLQKTGPLITSSANPPGEPTSVSLAEARAYFGEAVDFYVDGGDLSSHQSSTIIRVIDDAIEVLRQGAATIDL